MEIVRFDVTSTNGQPQGHLEVHLISGDIPTNFSALLRSDINGFSFTHGCGDIMTPMLPVKNAHEATVQSVLFCNCGLRLEFTPAIRVFASLLNQARAKKWREHFEVNLSLL